MPTAETLRALLAQVEEAKDGSRELDKKAFVIGSPSGQIYDEDWIPHYSSDTDAALALVAKVLPDTVRPWLVNLADGHRWSCALFGIGPDEGPFPNAEGATTPLAILGALLRALLQQSETAHVER